MLNSVSPSSNLDSKYTIKGSDLNLQILDHLSVAVYVCDMEGYITYFNESAQKLWSYTPTLNVDKWGGAKEIRNSMDIVIPNDAGPMALAIKSQIELKNIELIFLRHDGKKIHVLSNPKILRDQENKAIGVINNLVDITDQIVNENKQGRLAAIVDTCTDAIVSTDLNSRVTSWNHAAFLMSGIPENEAIGKNVSILIPEGRTDEFKNVQQRILNGEKIINLESVRNLKNGNEIKVSTSISPILDSTGKIVGLSTIARDITDVQLAMQKQSTLAAIVNGSDDTILSKTLNGIITSWNPAAEKMFGYSEKEAVGQHISILIPKNRRNEEKHIIKIIKEGRRIEHFETVRKTKGGKLIPISLTISPIFNKNGEIVGASKIARDITIKNRILQDNIRYIKSLESINTLAKLISSELNISNIIQLVLDESTELTGAKCGVFLHNKTDQENDNEVTYAMSGSGSDCLFHLKKLESIYPKLFKDTIIRSGDISSDQLYCNLPPFTELNSSNSKIKSYLSIPIKKRDDTLLGVIFLTHPEIDIFTAEQEIILAAVAAQAAISIDNAHLYGEVKLLNEKKDAFIGMASHELKTPITSISGYLQILRRVLTEEKQLYFLHKTTGIVKKLTNLVNDILDISKITAGKLSFSREKLDLQSSILEISELMSFSQQSHNINLNIPEEKVYIIGDHQRIEQVLINLISNAIKYAPNSKEINLSLTTDKEWAVITVQDFGMGISEDKIAHIFSRFYRVDDLRPEISGLGIGLYITKEIVDGHQGKIWVESEVNVGSTFHVAFPLFSV